MKLHCWMRHPKAQTSMDWPRGFWRGHKAAGLAIGRWNLILCWRDDSKRGEPQR